MQQIADWLESLGMSEYAQSFAENRIDFSILPDLTDQDLEKIGVILGDRRKMLRAIAALNGAPLAIAPAEPAVAPPLATAPATPIPAAAPPLQAHAGVEAAGERRYLTVMFCDLVGSTGISAQLDAEEWRDLVGSYLGAASAAVTGMGGHVAKKLGDGLMSLFGYPLAQENDAERAARAALAIQRALAELNRKNAGTGQPELVARIGLETGPAVVDAAGEIYGDVANIAARVQALAEPGAVLVTARVQRQVAGLFVAEDRGTHTLKGVPEPTALFRLVRASGGGRRSAQRNLSPLVGRDDEITMLTRRWERARRGDGQLVLIVGEPGLGKSRLIEEFHAQLADTPHTWVEWSCSQLLQNTPLHPIAEWGRARFGGVDVPAERRLAELESSLAQVKLDPTENAALLGPLLDIPLPAGRAPALAPEELRRRQLAALTNWVMAGAKVQPVVLAFEDLHWADPTTLDVLRGIAERGALAPLFILATTRPEFRPPWSMRSHHGTVSLAPLDRAQVHDMVAELSARHALPRDVVEDVAARTGGVPLFVEEVTRLLLERGEQGGIHVIPPTLQQSLMARLDRLGPAREVAQVGSVIGRGFSYGLLLDVAGMEDTPLQAALEKLAEADIVLVQGAPPDSDYRFKHALIQDAAYENLLKSRRQVLHRRVAEILRDRFADTAAAEPEALAYHFTQAGLTDAAIEWWGKAGDQALRRSAFQEAISHLGKAIEMADKAEAAAPGAGAATVVGSRRLKLQTTYSQALMFTQGFASEETKAAFTRAQQLAARIDNPTERFDTYYGLWVNSLLRGELTLARETAETFLRDAKNAGRMTEAGVASRNLGMTCFFQGDLTNARVYLQDAMNIYDPQRDREAKFRFGTDPGAAAGFLAHTTWLQGEIGLAGKLIEKGLAGFIESGHVPTLAYVYQLRAILEIIRDDAAATLRAAEHLIELSREHKLPLYLGWGLQESAWARARLGDGKAGAEELRVALAENLTQGNKVWVPFFQGLLAAVEAEGEQIESASAQIDQALALAEQTGEHWSDAFLHRIRGEILLKRDPANTAPAEEAFLAATAIAQQQKSKSFDLRAALSLAKLYQSTNRGADAHAVLAPALEGFSPTPEFPEIAEAQKLLAALAETDEIKRADAFRRRQVNLQLSYGNALIAARGHGAAETTAAFARARELAAGVADPAEQLSIFYGLWVGSFIRCEIPLAREVSAAALQLAERYPGTAEAAVAYRLHGLIYWFEGDFATARQFLERSLSLYDPVRDRDLAYRFGQDIGVAFMNYLAFAVWPLGETARAQQLQADAVSRARQSEHVPTLAYEAAYRGAFEMMRLDAMAAAPFAAETVQLAKAHDLRMYNGYGAALNGWVRAVHFGEVPEGMAEMRRGIEELQQIGINLLTPLFHVRLASLEAGSGDCEGGLARLDKALADSARNENRTFDAEVQRVRGEILLTHDPADAAAAEEAFLTAIAIAQRQKAKSFELRAALSLAKLYQTTNRAADAHAVLAPALEGFSPTPEFAEIAEAQAVLASL
jgi:class 3 adenylate cyclase/predicted ATPase